MNENRNEAKGLCLESRTTYSVSTHVFTAIFLFVCVGLFFWRFRWPWTLDMNSPDFNPMIGIPIFLAGAGLWQALRAALDSGRMKKFGRSYFHVSGSAIRLGHVLKGEVRVPASLKPTGPFEILVRCIQNIPRVNPSEDTASPRYREEVRWEARQAFTAADRGTAIPVMAQLPVVAPVQGRGAAYWILVVRAPCEGLDYEAVFSLPVQ